MKFLFDFLPLVLFFLVFKLGEGHQDAAHALANQYLGALGTGSQLTAEQSPIMLATAVAMLATIAQIAYLLARGRKVDGMLWVSLGVIGVMGGATIYFHDENFIKWKPTILYWAFAVALAVAQFGFGKNLMRKVMEAQIQLPDPIWARVNYAWMVFLSGLGLLNLFVAFVLFRNNTDAWVNFKVFGCTVIFFVFVFGLMLSVSKHIKEDA
ncbi:MAG: septation protein A [Telluria sp.]